MTINISWGISQHSGKKNNSRYGTVLVRIKKRTRGKLVQAQTQILFLFSARVFLILFLSRCKYIEPEKYRDTKLWKL